MKPDKPKYHDLEGWRFHTTSFHKACVALGKVEKLTKGLAGEIIVRTSKGQHSMSVTIPFEHLSAKP